MFDRAGRVVGDAVAKSRERERVRLEDRLGLLDSRDDMARKLVVLYKHRPGFGWMMHAEESRLSMVSRAIAIGDDELVRRVDGLASIAPPSEGPTPSAAIDAAYRALVERLAELRRETRADD